jgi:putative transposase
MEKINNPHNRRSLHLEDYDYSSPGAYFVTIVSYKRLPIFRKIINDKTHLSQLGRIVEESWGEIPSHFPFVSLDAYVIKPNHIHGIVIIDENDMLSAKLVSHATILKCVYNSTGPQSQSLGAIVGLFKSAATKRIHRLGITKFQSIWQRNYYDHIIRNEDDYQSKVEYIHTNPLNWEDDEDFVSINSFDKESI